VNMVSSAKVVYPNDVRGISIDANLTNVKLTLNNCSVDFTDASACDWAYAVNISGNGTGHTLAVNGGTYEGANVINAHGASNTIIVKDATLTSLYPNNEVYYGACIYVAQDANSSVVATGNTFNGNNAVAFNAGYTPVTESNNTNNTVKYDPTKLYIATLEELKSFRDSVNTGTTYAGVTVYLTADIDLASENWVGIGSINQDHGFMGYFDGNGKTIKNLTITNPTLVGGYAYAGFFSITEGSESAQNTIKNLTIENVTIETTGQIVAAAIAYPYYTIVENVTVCGDINIKGGNYTAGALAYTRRCVNASNVAVIGNDATTSIITGGQTVGGVISDIQMNGGLIADYSNFKAENLTITGEKAVGAISGIIAGQTLKGATVKNVKLVCAATSVGQVAGSLGASSIIVDAVVEKVTGATAIIGATYDTGAPVEVIKVDNVLYTSVDEARKDAETLAETLVATGGKTGVDAFNTMYLLGGSFEKDGDTLVYDYAFGVSNVAYEAGEAEPFKVTIAIKDADSTVARKLSGRTLVLYTMVEDTVVAKKEFSNPTFNVAADDQVTFDVSVALPEAGEGKATYFTVKVTDEE
ncbi:MAG: hypothetical protein IKZ27_06145, partial [Kiritimatiellae bacterium]|nr:hypothetical protein [Kiritimatiellia bacterium]